ncbi:YqcC family protein [Alteromonas aestuariivivens]|uniref:YqcC family protein n=1 Tax=Alteromonas aestuariivivens TaxID=1938339 RepID=A0A3D8M3T0_9ALTE|nr:YqcC family protein [Alteromonas aestuariivivens]RDV24393.1 YqcC family protein [Alteromonas aestuariivivens]
MKNREWQIKRQLALIEEQMRIMGIWSADMPTPEQLSSGAPFSCDTLSFEQWIQFILLPRLRFILENGQALPSAMAVAPAAEIYLTAECMPIIALLKELDRLITFGGVVNE